MQTARAGPQARRVHQGPPFIHRLGPGLAAVAEGTPRGRGTDRSR